MCCTPSDQHKTSITEIGTARRIAGNLGSMLASDALNRAATFVLYAMVARHLGAVAFGQMSLALTLFFTFRVLAVAGLGTLITREVAKDKSKTDQYLINGSAVVVLGSLLSIGILALFVLLMNYARGTASIILLLSFGLLPYSMSAICEAVFKAWERMHYIAYVTVPANIVRVVLGYLILSRGYGLNSLIIMLVTSYVATAGFEWWLMIRRITRTLVRVDFHLCLEIIRSTVTFFGIDGIAAIKSSFIIILLSKLAGEAELGLYNAAAQLMVPLALVYQSIAASIFPVMCKKFGLGFQNLKLIFERMVELLLVIGLPSVVGLFFLSESALMFLYGEEFLLASIIVRIMVWNLILVAINWGLGHVLLASMQERVILRIAVIEALLSLALGLILIDRFGLVGAALVVLLTGTVSFFLHYVPVSRLLSKITLGRPAWKPVLASLFMAIYLVLMRDQGFLFLVVSAGILYITVFIAVAIWFGGGPRKLAAEYLRSWSE